MTEKIVAQCSVDGCLKKRIGRGWCGKHYYRWRHYGDPLLFKNGFKSGESYAEIFWGRVAITADSTRCWNWLPDPNPQGYGAICINRRQWLAHRLAWFLFYGREATMDLLHSCDNRRCVNPNHLREGTKRENVQDAIDRDRILYGEHVGTATITNATARTIYQYLQDGYAVISISKLTGATRSVIYGIRQGKSWVRVVNN